MHRAFSIFVYYNEIDTEAVARPPILRLALSSQVDEEEAEVYSIDKAVNRVYCLMPPDLCPKPSSTLSKMILFSLEKISGVPPQPDLFSDIHL
ncbi:hypothetical protein ACJMK2_009566 [Sinanodonta woodiana]|uniref:Uncharacterized protein n=1 Tax=Sinanodonta woodiana TaxID=1069815 RepID=A0ABD3VCN1_SINWO